ncbi:MULTISPECIES: hypothetical protein [unclassified Kitasatospora]|uniref:hypothetical protein n=1 Tax=unclassified Kitasatospora TaxID=2633591 RepID=UPI00070E5A75|nr:MULTISPECIES: hypothetical protein [unclassified Kitasatospora]KQV20827.1 hypothetical protein ASC99_20170 [Kitasatospora sp. Root107]KRB60516.1 hypothetical protein ASE03_13005 [Kitasatospora sp. Root187]
MGPTDAPDYLSPQARWEQAAAWATQLVGWYHDKRQPVVTDGRHVTTLVACGLYQQVLAHDLPADQLGGVRLDLAARDLPSMPAAVLASTGAVEGNGADERRELTAWLSPQADPADKARARAAATLAREIFDAHRAKCPDPATPLLGDRADKLIARQNKQMLRQMTEVFGTED